jgi:hypothetical protein
MKPDALPQDQGAHAYLDSLADAAEQWFNRRPEDAAGLAKRLAEMRQGCSTLLLADHRPLAEEDRVWLRTRCRDWAVKLDGYLAAVERGQDVNQVRSQADATIRQAAAALRTRAQEVRNRGHARVASKGRVLTLTFFTPATSKTLAKRPRKR